MLDWDQLRTFLAIARHGNLTTAAREAGVTQSTMGRRLDALHASVGARLLQKTPGGYVMTPAGERVLGTVERMEREALSVERAVAGEDERVVGEVSITTVEAFGARVVTPLLLPLLLEHQDLQIEMITDYRSLSLSRREADVAIRLSEFHQHEAVVTRVGEMVFGLYASPAYLEANGVPRLPNGAEGHSLITNQRDLSQMPETEALTTAAPGARIALRANSRAVQVEAVRAGCGIGMLPCYLAREFSDLVELERPGGRIARDLWLGIHRDARQVRRIRLVVDRLTSALRCWSAAQAA